MRRAETALINSGLGEDERAAARLELQHQSRNASATRMRNRDVVDGRPRGHLCTFGISRVRMREMAHRGEPPGITKSSW